MKVSKVRLVYFSATYTTRRIVREIASQIGLPTVEHDITGYGLSKGAFKDAADVMIEEDEMILVGMPVYAGRIPSSAAKTLQQFKGNGSPAIIVCVYGNREYDDALVEMADLLEGRGFKIVSAGAFIAQHSIFPKVGDGRPDIEDMLKIKEFALMSKDRILALEDRDSIVSITSSIKGNRPYKTPGSIPIFPSGDRKCTSCQACVKACPTGAINSTDPRKTDKELCIKCGRCVAVCPADSRKFRGIVYKVAERKFVAAYSDRKEPEIF